MKKTEKKLCLLMLNCIINSLTSKRVVITLIVIGNMTFDQCFISSYMFHEHNYRGIINFLISHAILLLCTRAFDFHKLLIYCLGDNTDKHLGRIKISLCFGLTNPQMLF